MAAVLDLTALAKRHEAVSGAAFPIAGSTKTWNVIHLHQPAHDFIQRPGITDVKLFRFCVIRLRLAVTANAGTGASADLGDAKVQNPFSAFLTFSGGDDHTGVRNGNADTCHDLCKGIIINTVVKFIGIDIVRMTKPRHADRVRSDAECSFQMFCVHEKTCKFIAVFVQSK